MLVSQEFLNKANLLVGWTGRKLEVGKSIPSQLELCAHNSERQMDHHRLGVCFVFSLVMKRSLRVGKERTGNKHRLVPS